MPSKIEWTDETLNPITGCTPVSSACTNCYAKRLAETRLRGRMGYDKDNPFQLTLHQNRVEVFYKKHGNKKTLARLREQGKKYKPRIFLGSMTDMFHEDMPSDWLSYVLSMVVDFADCFTWIILTKRPENAYKYLVDAGRNAPNTIYRQKMKDILKVLWLGVTAENQEMADQRIPILLNIPAAVRFVSAEPLLESISINQYLQKGLDWCIIGSESGPGKRPFNPEWAWEIIQQCKKNQKPVFYKQDQNEKTPKINGRRYTEFPLITTNQKENL